MKANSCITLLAALHVTSAALDKTALSQQYFGNDAAWYLSRIPFFESSNKQLTDVYYYRWQIYRSHQRDTGSTGFISTEFLDDVGWQTGPWGSLNDAAGFHLTEGRWCRDRRFREDYARFMYSSQSNPRQYTEWMADSIWKTYLVDGNVDAAIARLGDMQNVWDAWNDALDQSKGLYWVEPLRDATEYTINSIDASNGQDGFGGGQAFRPSINSYQYANARAIAQIATLKGNSQSVVDKYNGLADNLKKRVQSELWNSQFQHFVDRSYQNNDYVKYYNFIRGRELVGYAPWGYDLPDDNATYASAWKHMLNTNELKGEHGLRTVEPSYQYYMRQYRYEGTRRECQWNGPVWPYQFTQVLTALANVLDHYPNTRSSINIADYTSAFITYANLHTNNVQGGLNLEENYDPATGDRIVGLDRSNHYFHSGYIDNILSGLVGIRARADDVLEVNPLADPSQISFFRADTIAYHGHDIAVQWDKTGSRYGRQGLVVEVDGRIVASSNSLTRLTVAVSRNKLPNYSTPIAKSIQALSSTRYPSGSVSVTNADIARVHDAIDGRVMFWPQSTAANGWDSPAGNGVDVWYQIDFGASTSTSRTEIAFFVDTAQGFDVPASYKVQVYNGSAWVDVSGAKYASAVANGITNASWNVATANMVRLVFRAKDGVKVRLVEFKLY
ncbi:six-hairpin glycosidase [Pseudovirgaria hyperparasitica]|uniref:Six-hairpin glycosidase n=1 Tax=Pseudovirgaria hyperparasitica TaxID=470096 RepID=A0A6A6W4R0_9PEZI|nr:six-hairpin glycosidase [Pseudovirgaria hyperparasitica]KAF2757545.1 six-hairpin glycosidase [Pseudovirgaria hyperparasitica]